MRKAELEIRKRELDLEERRLKIQEEKDKALLELMSRIVEKKN